MPTLLELDRLRSAMAARTTAPPVAPAPTRAIPDTSEQAQTAPSEPSVDTELQTQVADEAMVNYATQVEAGGAGNRLVTGRTSRRRRDRRTVCVQF